MGNTFAAIFGGLLGLIGGTIAAYYVGNMHSTSAEKAIVGAVGGALTGLIGGSIGGDLGQQTGKAGNRAFVGVVAGALAGALAGSQAGVIVTTLTGLFKSRL